MGCRVPHSGYPAAASAAPYIFKHRWVPYGNNVGGGRRRPGRYAPGHTKPGIPAAPAPAPRPAGAARVTGAGMGRRAHPQMAKESPGVTNGKGRMPPYGAYPRGFIEK